jgi:hypothetical protein
MYISLLIISRGNPLTVYSLVLGFFVPQVSYIIQHDVIYIHEVPYSVSHTHPLGPTLDWRVLAGTGAGPVPGTGAGTGAGAAQTMVSRPKEKNWGRGVGQHRHTGLGGAVPSRVPIWISPGCANGQFGRPQQRWRRRQRRQWQQRWQRRRQQQRRQCKLVGRLAVTVHACGALQCHRA